MTSGYHVTRVIDVKLSFVENAKKKVKNISINLGPLSTLELKLLVDTSGDN